MCPAGSWWLLLGLLVGISVISCKRVKPQPPDATAFDDTLAIGPSYLSAPVLFEVRELEEKVNQSLGEVLVDQESLPKTKGTVLRLRVLRSGRVRMSFDGKRLSFGAPITIWIDNPLDLNHKRQQLGSLDVEFNSPVAVTPNWRILTRVTLKRYRWTVEPKVKLLGIRFNVKRRVDRILQKRRPEIEQAISAAIYQELRLDREIGKIWRSLHRPLRINRNYENIWLVPHPYAISASKVYGNRKTIVVPLRVELRLETHFGDRPDSLRPAALPPLRRADTLPPVTELNLLSRVSYDRLNLALKRTLKNKKLEVAAQSISIQEAMVYGGGNTLILETKVKGAINGTLFFRGRPAFDTLRQTAAVRNFEYDIHTEDVLPHTADYFLHDMLKDSLQQALSLPLHRYFSTIPVKIETAFERGRPGRKADLDIQTFRFIPRQIAIRPEAIHVHLRVRTSFRIKITDV